jgi:hypothetical protein
VSIHKAHQIRETAATFNAAHDYDLAAALELSAAVIRHAHLVQVARTEAKDPQMMLPIGGEAFLP